MLVKIYKNKQAKKPMFVLDTTVEQTVNKMIQPGFDKEFANKENLKDFSIAAHQYFMVVIKMMAAFGFFSDKNYKGKKHLIEAIEESIAVGERLAGRNKKIGFFARLKKKLKIRALKKMQDKVLKKMQKETDIDKLNEGRELLEKLAELIDELE